MSCEAVTGAIVALLDGELAQRERDEVESHLASCSACAGEAHALRATRRVVTGHLAALGEEVVSAGFDQLWRRVEAGEGWCEPRPGPAPARRRFMRGGGSGSRPGRGPRRWVWTGASAGVALAAGLALIVLGQRPFAVAPVPLAGDDVPGPPGVSPPVTRPGAVKPAMAPPARVGRSVAAGAPVRDRLAHRAQPAPAAEASRPDAGMPPDGAVAVNEIDPPRELIERPDLFLNYPIVRKLDELRNLDAVLAGQGDVQPGDGGAG